MCGICGIVYGDGERPVDRATLEAMTRLMAHRGPDGEGYHLDGPVGLGHRRLSVIDVEAGVQPMANEDGTLRLVYNGEIYNFRELAEELKARGHRFRTRCDTEVILHLYEEHGTACLKKLRGMFSFALWDGRRRRLFCARDRLGVKPFFYRHAGGDFIFASGPEPILRHPGVERRVDLEALDLYLTYQYVPAPFSIFERIRKLPPAHLLLLEGGRVTVERYWEANPERPMEIGYDEARARLRDLLAEATRLRLVSDVPLGAFLSGGIDSSIVVALMSREGGGRVKTFSIGFEDERYNELPYARMVAQRYGTDHHELVVKPDAVGLLPKLVRHYGEPFADSSALPTYHVAEISRRQVTVALNGDAGDELFAGYDRYRAYSLAGRMGRFPGAAPLARPLARLLAGAPRDSVRDRARRFAESFGLTGPARYLRYIAYFGEEEKARLYAPRFREAAGAFDAPGQIRRLYEACRMDDETARLLFTDLHSYLPGDLLVKVDIATMAVSLEARSPFLDHRVVEFAAALPTRWKLRGGEGKRILRDACADLLPGEILRRGKRGFGVPISRWFRTDLRGYLREILLDPSSLGRGYFDPARVRELVDHHQRGFRDHSYRLWALLALELWHREFIDGGGAA